ncbi:MAG: Nif3-like dinuclear metal center hexameric protein [Epulopiscium sp. Nele67-Bin004]|nr:MAG: Nif3-like dinuclear metal center hexameric protein [Epulopiscium sp. Nele67-Bin004]
MKLSNRLQIIASYVPQGTRLADIGTDHAHIPAYLSSKVDYIIASDKNAGPLENARRNTQNLSNVDIRLGDGLSSIYLTDNIQTIIIAGMGGHVIQEILKNGMEVVQNSQKLILSPHTAQDEVTEFIKNIGFKLVSKHQIEDSGKYYTIIVADNIKFYKGEKKMYTVKDVMEKLEYLAPVNIAESWDNVGVLVGADDEPVTKIMCALDINDAIIDEAIDEKVDCIITHHPFIFSAFKKIDYNTPLGRGIRKLIMNKISLIAMHTNFDSAFGGINDIICKRLNITGTKVLNNFGCTEQKYGLGRFGMTTAITLDELIANVKVCFDINHLRLIGTTDEPIKTISVCSGRELMRRRWRKKRKLESQLG